MRKDGEWAKGPMEHEKESQWEEAMEWLGDRDKEDWSKENHKTTL